MNILDKKIIIFDLDGTLAPSKSPVEEGMVLALSKLLVSKKVAVISGGSFDQFNKQFLNNFSKIEANFENLYIMPTSGTSLYIYKKPVWSRVYTYEFTEMEKAEIFEAFKKVLTEVNLPEPEKIFGKQIEDRQSQITFSYFGQEAPFEIKKDWDPDGAKREAIIEKLEKEIPKFSIRLGGTTSIDINKQANGKAFGVKRLLEYIDLEKQEALFVGDKIVPGGNDYPAYEMGLDCINVADEQETLGLINSWL